MIPGRKPAPPVKVKSLQCRACGAPIEIRSGPRAQVIVCAYCDTSMDAQDPTFKILWQYQQQIKFEPLIPIGARGTLRGELLECIGYMRRTVTVEGIDYTWSEYLLYNPFKGYRWLTEFSGHWSFVKECFALPVGPNGMVGVNPPDTAVNYMGLSCKHFQSAEARVTYCIGEFYWHVEKNQRNRVHDYVSPPYVLSAEESANEITWSLGEYVTAKELWDGFKLKTAPPAAVGVAPNQPNPLGNSRILWRNFGLFTALAFLITLFFTMFCPSREVFSKSFQYYANEKEKAQVTENFKITGRPCNVEIDISSSLYNRWAMFNMALINADTFTAVDFGQEVSYYHGVEGGESWTEGDRNSSAVVGQVSSGTYFLRVDPESGTGNSPDTFNPQNPAPGPEVFSYTVKVYRDVTQWLYFWLVVGVLLPLPIIQSIRSASFENRRWMESDHPPVSNSSED